MNPCSFSGQLGCLGKPEHHQSSGGDFDNLVKARCKIKGKCPKIDT